MTPLLILLSCFLPLASSLVGQTCFPDATSAHESWQLQPSGLLQLSSTVSDPQCASLSAWPPTETGTLVLMAPCNSSSPSQLFSLLPGNASLVLRLSPSHCLNLEAYGTTPGTVAWVTYCDSAACKGNCAWGPGPNSTLVQTDTGLCLQDGSTLPPLPHTCAPESPSAGLPFCNPDLDVSTRVDDLLGRLTVNEKVALFNMGTGGFGYIPRLNVKAWHHDFTCIRGVNFPNGLQNPPPLNVSVFPHAIAQAATFDVDLVAAVSNATAYEARAINQVVYAASGGTLWAGTSCDGGPLANTVHDPRWGRISECYGEGGVLASAMGIVVTRTMQNRSSDARWLRTSQVTRHWLGYHMATPDLPNGGEEEISLHAFGDLQGPVYRAFQVGGGAEGLMCGYASFSIGGQSRIPSCMHPFLWEKLREEWGWVGFVQTDCCDSITSAVEDHQYFPNISAAVLAAIELGVSVYFGLNAGLVDAVGGLLASNSLDGALFDERLRAPLLMRFRTGEFDAGGGNPQYPYSAPLDPGALDGPEHRTLARACVAASAVLLENREVGAGKAVAAGAGAGAGAGASAPALALPLSLPPGAKLAVIGPFADCQSRGVNDRDVDTPLQCTYEHSYGGESGAVATLLSAAREEGVAGGWEVVYAQGTNIHTEMGGGNGTGIAAAVGAAASAQATVLVLGLGLLFEEEGRDRTTLRLPAVQEELLAAVANATATTPWQAPLILVILSGGLVDTNFSAPGAVIQLFYPGAEAGHGLWDVLLGRVSPSGRLPITAYKEPYLAALHDTIANFSLVSSTGVGKTYRYADDSSPYINYWFGYGLSFGVFNYSALQVDLLPPPGPGAPPEAPFATVRATVTNIGRVGGAEVAQVYIRVPRDATAVEAVGGAPIPQRALAAFTKTAVLPPGGGGGQQLEWVLPLSAFETTAADGSRVVTGGNYTVVVAGHAPGDPNGPSNELVAVVVVPTPGEGRGGGGKHTESVMAWPR